MAKAAITTIGSYNGIPAFEYEIRDDSNRLLATDVVIIHPTATETWADLARFIESRFLPIRVAKWELSDTEEKRQRRREKRSGGKRLRDMQNGSPNPPRLRGRLPTNSELRTVTLSRAQAEALQRHPLRDSDTSDRDEEVQDSIRRGYFEV